MYTGFTIKHSVKWKKNKRHKPEVEIPFHPFSMTFLCNGKNYIHTLIIQGVKYFKVVSHCRLSNVRCEKKCK
jgi:hypothetical protein